MIHIQRGALFRVRRLSRRLILLTGSSVLVVAGLVVSTLMLYRSQQVFAATPPDSCFAFTAGTGTITDYYDNEGNNPANPACPRAVDIPSAIGGVGVISIGDYAFSYNQLTAVTIPTNVVNIGKRAFQGNYLTSVIIPDSLQAVSEFAFYNNQLTKVTLPDSITSLGDSVFMQNYLSSITIPSSVTAIGPMAFASNQLTSVDIPHSVTSLSYSVFYGNPLTSLTIAAPTIPDAMFYGVGLTSLTLEEGVVNIGAAAFLGNKITSLVIPDSVVSIGDAAFYNNKLSFLVFGSDVTSIGSASFAYNQLTSVNLPVSVTSINTAAFANNNLVSVIVQGSPTLADNVFALNGIDESTIPPTIMVNSADYYEYYQNNANFVRLYSTNPDFIAAHQDTLYTSTSDSVTYTTSGYLINPTPVTINYVDITSAPLQPSVTKVSDTYADYRLNSLTSTLTPDSYYHIGSTKTFTAPTIDGYVLVSNPTQTSTLTAGANEITFTYAQPVLTVPFANKTVANYVLTDTTPPSALTSELVTQSNLSLSSTGDCSTVSSANLLSPDGVTAPTGATLLGGVDFSLKCSNAGVTTVTYALGAVTDTARLRVYKSHNGTLSDITSHVVFATQTIDGVARTVLAYALADGGEFDEDGVVNGVIVDPVYVGVVTASQNSNSASSTATNLAATGERWWNLVGVSAMFIAAGLAVLAKRLVHKL